MFEQINTTVSTAVGRAGVIVSLISYYSDLQLTLAVASSVVVGAVLMLAFTLKEDRLDVQPPLYRRAPISGEYFKQSELKFTYIGTYFIPKSEFKFFQE
jgi:hypothetical protein